MFICNLDGSEFEDGVDAMEHLRDQHSDLIHEELWTEFLGEAEERVFIEQIDEVDEYEDSESNHGLMKF